MNHLLLHLWQNLLRIIFPAFCLGCKKEGDFLCQKCLSSLIFIDRQCCPICHKPQLQGNLCNFCKNSFYHLESVMAYGNLKQDPLLKKCISHFKYQYLENLAIPFGEILWKAFQQMNFEGTTICPVPLHLTRFKFRGFNQSELLARQLIHLNNKNSIVQLNQKNLLKRIRFHDPQKELSREERILNMENAFILDQKFLEEVKGDSILLIDDVATTISTLNSCAKVLKTAGAKSVRALVLARAYQ